MIDLAGRVLLLTGAAGGIGTAIARMMRERCSGLVAETAMRRTGRTEEVVGPVLFLASGLASFITGETLHVNGGLYIHS